MLHLCKNGERGKLCKNGGRGKRVVADKDGRMCKQPAMVTDFICVSSVAVCYNCAHGSTDRHSDVPDPPGCSL
jgi:hypothetical protein